MQKVRYITNLSKVEGLSEHERHVLKPITDKFVFRVNDYYLNLIDWNDPNDPIRKLVIPSEGELQEYGRWDASDEDTNYVVPGCQHKYKTTALLIVSEVCGAYCRYCFRKRLFRNDVKEAVSDVEPGLKYISEHPEINNVLLTGGDSLILSTRRLRMIVERLRAIVDFRLFVASQPRGDHAADPAPVQHDVDQYAQREHSDHCELQGGPLIVAQSP